jgi:hypothetical protein
MMVPHELSTYYDLALDVCSNSALPDCNFLTTFKTGRGLNYLAVA